MEPSATTNTRSWLSYAGHLVGAGCGAANDNLFRAAFIVAAQRGAAEAAETIKPLFGILFMIPFLILAPTAGSLGDRLPRRRVMLTVRSTELVLCLIGAVAVATGSLILMLITLLLLATQSAFYGPVKYASIPELVSPRDLERANGAMQAVTAVAILLGTALMGLLDPAVIGDGPALAWRQGGWLLALSLVLALIGLAATGLVARLPAADPGRRLLTPLSAQVQFTTLGRRWPLWRPTLGLSAYWAFGAMAMVALPGVAHQQFALDEAGASLLMVAMALGVVVGSLFAPLVIVRAVPAATPIAGALLAGGSMLAGLLVLDPPLAGLGPANTLGEVVGRSAQLLPWLFTTGIGGGLWTVSCNVLLQERTRDTERGLIYGAINAITNLALLAGFAVLLLAAGAGISNATALGWGAGLVAGGALVAAWLARVQVFSWAFALLVRLGWRIRVTGSEHVPTTGGCVVVCNHLSYVDGPILATHLPRRARFLVHGPYFRIPLLGWLLRLANCEPIDGQGRHRALLATVEAAVAAARRGEVVALFPEGKLSRSGHLDRFQRGVERIARRAGVPVVPAHLHGLHGGLWSRARRRRPQLRPSVDLRFGPPLRADASAGAMRHAVAELAADAAHSRAAREHRSLGRRALARARWAPLTAAVTDQGGSLSRLRLAAVAMAVRPRLGLATDERRVGVLLPPGRAGMLINLALALDARTVVNLNHTVGLAGLERMCDLADIRTIITARRYRDKAAFDLPDGPRVVELEQLLPSLGTLAVLARMAAILCLPHHLLDRGRADDPLTIIFSSGTTADPKGVVLTHRQVSANIEATRAHLELDLANDVLLAPLPLFHSFGLTVGNWLPLVLGVPVAAHPDPRDARAIGALAEATRASFLVSTATFVRQWMRRITSEQFASLRFAVVGAEKCPPDLATAFRSKYGAELLEGYGCTELAPVVATNRLDVDRDGLVETCHRPGTVGRPLPGIAVTTIDPDSREPLAHGCEGLLVVRSPARMSGYLDRDDLTARALVGEAYDTGDIGRVDDDGFITITGRLARFAKVGGEMVPLDKVESLLAERLAMDHGEDWGEVAVAAVPDPGKGERLVVLRTAAPETAAETVARLADLPPLFVPRERDVHPIDAIPVLGTGKRDLKALAELAREVAT